MRESWDAYTWWDDRIGWEPDALVAVGDGSWAAFATARAAAQRVYAAAGGLALNPRRREHAEQKREQERRQQYLLLCDILGDPSRPAHIDPDWLAWEGGRIREIAASIYTGRRFDALPILADALEEAGCQEPLLLDHCREVGEHVRGCWVVDLALGRT
ncbi:MAG: hypothetical protein L0Z62_13285 [Gemmataceae bacterium]|nr:hypothetical protein [Gemmataceae bacterium]